MFKITMGALLGLVAGLGTAQAAEYRLDPAKSLLVVKTQKDGPAARMAHNHVIAAREFSGSVTWDPADPGTAGVRVEAKTASLEVDDPALRKRFGETSVPSDGDRKDVTKNMQAEDQLDVAHFPTMKFESTKVEKVDDKNIKVTGNLSLRGVTKPVSFPATVEVDGATFHGKGSFTFRQTTFGWKPYSAFFGAVKNADEVTMTVDLVGTAEPAKAPAP